MSQPTERIERIDSIRPTQLYISEEKYRNAVRLFEERGLDLYDALPVKRIGRDLFFTDGHSRALVLQQSGIEQIRVVDDTDDMDWIMYLVDLMWCREEGIASIRDLETRVVDGEEYQRLWIDRCSEKHDRLKADPLADLEIEFEHNEERKADTCDEVLRSLPDWFGIEDSIREYVDHVRTCPFLTAGLYGKVVGFCALDVKFDINCELHVPGIFDAFHRRGIGRRMVARVDEYCRGRQIPYMTVKTLSARRPAEQYEKTRRFCEACGFRSLEEFPTLWSEANPCLYMVRDVGR